MKYLSTLFQLSIVLCVVFFSPIHAYAIEYVYRAITNEALRGGPDKIFKDGMHAPGADTNLYRHISTLSNNDTTAYISTTIDRQTAITHGAEWPNDPQDGFWVYQIRLSNIAIDVGAAWRYMIPRLPSSFVNGPLFSVYNRELTEEAEVSFLYSIRNTDIVSATFYQYVDVAAGNRVSNVIRHNPNYVERPVTIPIQVYYIEIPELGYCFPPP